MKKLFLVVMACYGLTARAQLHDSKNFVYLYSDSVIYAKRILLRPNFSGQWQLRVDSHRLPSEQVKFFCNEEGFFANTRRLNFRGTSLFSERIIEGRINLFQETDYDPLLYHREYRYSNSSQAMISQKLYYNKGFGNIKKVNYNNLQMDMADHAESMDLLESYRKSMNTKTVLYTSAAVAAAAGLISFFIEGSSSSPARRSSDAGFGSSIADSNGGNFTASFLLLGLGAGLGVGGYLIHESGTRHLENAVDAYNR